MLISGVFLQAIVEMARWTPVSTFLMVHNCLAALSIGLLGTLRQPSRDMAAIV
jgi:hypothetical protein